MEINITRFFNEGDMHNISASAAEMGQNVGVITWRNAQENSPRFYFLDNNEKRAKFRKYVKGFGAWDAKEIASWSDNDLNALFLQLIAGDVREVCADPSDGEEFWIEYEEGAESGRYAGRFYKGDDGEIYYYIGD